MSRRTSLDLADYVAGVRDGDPVVLGRALTLVESTRPDQRVLAAELIAALQAEGNSAHRVGITGVPGVGKSTLIERLGCDLLEAGLRVAVLAVDPTSQVSGGSILGDKTRMQSLAADPRAFVRPSPTAGAHGGVGRYTREAIRICEAAGFDVVLVETVGVGQIEASVAQMVDTYLLLLLAGACDELQGMKRGVMELADVVAVNKADGSGLQNARSAARMTRNALKLMRGGGDGWSPPVLTCSALEGEGVPEVWNAIADHRVWMEAEGRWETQRRDQRLTWFQFLLEGELLARLDRTPAMHGVLGEVRSAIEEGRITAPEGVRRVLARLA